MRLRAWALPLLASAFSSVQPAPSNPCGAGGPPACSEQTPCCPGDFPVTCFWNATKCVPAFPPPDAEVKTLGTTFSILTAGTGDGLRWGDLYNATAIGYGRNETTDWLLFWDGSTPPYTLGTRDPLIAGWKYGVEASATGALGGMRVGETRLLTIPSQEGYGEKGNPEWDIPPRAQLIYQVTVEAIFKGPPPVLGFEFFNPTEVTFELEFHSDCTGLSPWSEAPCLRRRKDVVSPPVLTTVTVGNV